MRIHALRAPLDTIVPLALIVSACALVFAFGWHAGYASGAYDMRKALEQLCDARWNEAARRTGLIKVNDPCAAR